LSMLCVLILFTPALFMSGAIRGMFLPLTLAVGFAVAASYVFSSTLVPVLAVLALKLDRAHRRDWFYKMRGRYRVLVGRIFSRRCRIVTTYLAGSVLLILVGLRHLGSEIYPKVNSSEVQLRIRAPSGTDIDGTEAILLKTLKIVNEMIGPVEFSLGFVGL